MTQPSSHPPDLLARIQHEDASARRVLIRQAAVISMDNTIGDLPSGDLLIEGSKIAAVAPDLSAAASDGGAIVIDAEGMIAIPGLQDTHRHSWQTQLRRMFCDVTLAD